MREIVAYPARAVDLYFAYGSNLAVSRLRKRVPSAHPVGRAQLSGHQLTFDKRGQDGSGKANIAPRDRFSTWGALYQFEASSWALLDTFEPGYERLRVEVTSARGEVESAGTYRAIESVSGLLPRGWYKQLIADGAREHALPEEYLAFLDAIRAG